jgi:hypothetical protein
MWEVKKRASYFFASIAGIDIKLSANIPKRTKRASGVTIYRKEKKVLLFKMF